MNSILIVAYLALFVTAGLLFVFVNLFIGRFLRPKDPHAEKLEIYECGEPTIGTSYVQFDLRFYVVALLFLIFDVEVAFFFPWATVFGKATHLKDPALHAVVQEQAPDDRAATLTQREKSLALRERAVRSIYDEMGVPRAQQPDPSDVATITRSAQKLTWFSFIDILVFFGVILVGFAYVWMRGDLDWVRAIGRERAAVPAQAAVHRPPPKQTAVA